VELGLLIFRLFLAGIFAVAGVAKLADPAGSRKAVSDFGVPSPVAGIAVFALPAVELAIAALLLFPSVSWFGAVGSVALLSLFIGGMIYQMAKGRAPDCH